MNTAIATSGRSRLEQLYEVSKLFTAFANVDDTVGQALQVVAATLPLESALLIQATIACHTEITVWQCEDSAPARLVAARAHAEAVYAYLVGARSVDALDLQDRLGSATLPAPRDRCVPSEHTRRFVMIPLVVARGMVFGALQLEAASDLDRDDVEFVNALANQLAIALDRDRTRRHDVVRRREAQLSQARYESVVDRLDSAFIWEADLETRRMSYVSAQFEHLLGFSRSECLDDRNWWRSHVPPDDRRLLEQTFERALVERGDQRCDHRVVTSRNAIRWLHTSVHLADVPGEAPRFQGLSCDITAAKAEQDRIRDQLSFVSAVVSSLGEATLAVDLDGGITFINPAGTSLLGCSGDEALGRATVDIARVVDREGEALECPLALAIRSGADVRRDDHMVRRSDGSRFRASYTAAAIRRDGCVTGAVLSFHEVIERGAARDDERFLDFASIEAGRCAIVTSPQDVAAIITESTASFEPVAIRRGVRLLGETPAAMPLIRCDRERVLQVIAHLLSNALKVVNQGGSVYLRVKSREKEAVFSVADTGPGIALAEHAHLFERHWRSPQVSYPGLGLGLANARGIVEAHGGRIWADSEVGLGATFFFTIPLAASP